MFSALSPAAWASGSTYPMSGIMKNHTRNEPQHIMRAYLRPIMYPRPRIAAPVFSFTTSFALSAMAAPKDTTREVRVSLQRPTVATMKSYKPPMRPATTSVFALEPPLSPLTRTCVVAVASGNGYFPCISFTKYLRKGMRKRIPSTPPRSELSTICQ